MTSPTLDRLDRSLILLGLAVYLLSTSVLHDNIYLNVFVTFSTFPYSDLRMVGLSLDLVN